MGVYYPASSIAARAARAIVDLKPDVLQPPIRNRLRLGHSLGFVGSVPGDTDGSAVEFDRGEVHRSEPELRFSDGANHVNPPGDGGVGVLSIDVNV